MGYTEKQIKEAIDVCYKVGSSGSINQDDMSIILMVGDILDGLVEESRV
jgi:hypothetical protein